jgi:hypothetical protein
MQLNLTSDKLTIDLEWYEQLWAFTFTKRFEIPRIHIVSATTDAPQSTWKELRAPGTFLPGVIKAGTYYTDRGKEFWYVTDDKNYLTIELIDEPYRRMIFTLEQSASWAEQINQSLLPNKSWKTCHL